MNNFGRVHYSGLFGRDGTIRERRDDSFTIASIVSDFVMEWYMSILTLTMEYHNATDTTKQF